MTSLLSGGEIVNLHLGGCGSNIAAAFWQILCKEHDLVTRSDVERCEQLVRNQAWGEGTRQCEGLRSWENSSQKSPCKVTKKHHGEGDNGPCLTTAHGEDGLCVERNQNLNVFFDETMHRFVPRAIFVDQDPVRLSCRFQESDSALSLFFRRENFVFARSGSKGIYRKPDSHDIQRMLWDLNQKISQELERADALQGFQLTNHLGGGGGSTLATACLHLLRDDMGTKPTITMTSLFPSLYDASSHRNGIEFYNCLLALPEVADCSDITFVIDNDALHDICFRLISLAEPGWSDLNHLVATGLSSLTSCMRFSRPKQELDCPGSYCLHLRDLPVLLGDSNHKTPAFVLPGFSPLCHRESFSPLKYLQLKDANWRFQGSSDTFSPPHHKTHSSRSYRSFSTRMPSVKSLAQSLFRPSHFFSSVDPLGHYYIKTLALFRGDVSYQQIEQEINYGQVHGNAADEEWAYCLPRDLLCKFCSVPDLNLHVSAFFAASTTAFGIFLQDLANQYEKMLSRRVFLHVFLQQGVEEAEFYEKLERVRTMITSYEDAFSSNHQEAIEFYQAKSDLGEIPFSKDITQCEELMFKTHQPVRLRT